MARLKPGEKRVQLSFVRPDDVRLFDFMERQAYEARYDLSTFILVALQKAFEGQVPEPVVPPVAPPTAFGGDPVNTEPYRPAPQEPVPIIEAGPAANIRPLTPELEEEIRGKIAARVNRRGAGRGAAGRPTQSAPDSSI